MRLALALLIGPLAAAAAPLHAKATLYHFNVQYVAGGMERFPDGVGRDPKFSMTETEVEDVIITESFAPLLDVLELHPRWHVDLEMQGLMIEVMAARHGATLDRLRRLAKRGQVEVVSFHYSDQLFLAYPKRDLVRSVELNKQVFVKHDIPLSPVVFTQEGQFNEGMLKVMAEHGYTTAVMANNLYDWQYGGPPPSRFMTKHGVDVVLNGGSVFGDLTVEWAGPGDGELIVTGNTSPYLGPGGFKRVEEEVRLWEQGLAADEAAGKKLLTVSELVAEAKARGTFTEMPHVLDGTWRPRDTKNLARWMGTLGGLFDLIVVTEHDNFVLTNNVQASLDVAACEAVIAWAAREMKSGHAQRALELETASRELMLAEVSDSTGWTPWLGEVQYSLAHAKAAREAARRCIDSPPLRRRTHRRVDLKTGEVTDGELEAVTRTKVEGPFEVRIDAPGRQVTATWSRLSDDRLELVVEAAAGTHKNDHRLLSVTFPMGFERIAYSPALDEGTLVDVPASQYAPGVQQTIPAPNGLVGLGPSRWLVKDTRSVHVAALLRAGARELELRDETLHASDVVSWRFEVVDGDAARALAVANEVNVTPVLAYELEPKPAGACSVTGGGLALFALLVLSRWLSRGFPSPRPSPLRGERGRLTSVSGGPA